MWEFRLNGIAPILNHGARMRRPSNLSHRGSNRSPAARQLMPQRIVLDKSLSWRQIDDIAEGAALALSQHAQARIRAAHTLVESIVRKGVRAYGVNTGVGALCDVVVTESKQAGVLRKKLVYTQGAGGR